MSARKFLFCGNSAQPVRMYTSEIVSEQRFGNSVLPAVKVPKVEGTRLAAWATENGRDVTDQLITDGAILFRGFSLSIAEFSAVVRAVTPDLLTYSERAAPRSEVAPNIYTSTEYPADQEIPLHHEMSYSHAWPKKLWFYCAQAPAEGGRTPIADDREIYTRIPSPIKKMFLKNVMYVRNYDEHLDMTWQEVFQTNERSEVERYCTSAGMSFEWKPRGGLRTTQVRPAIAVHPLTGDTVWFNHAHLFHSSNLTVEVREALMAQLDERELPRNAFFGDGSPIPVAVLDEIRDIYREAAVRFNWQTGDVLLLDNFLVSHGREPFIGPRRVLVAMAEMYSNPDVQRNS